MNNLNNRKQQVNVNPFLKQLVIALTIYICSFLFTRVKYYKEVLKIITVLILTGKDLIKLIKVKEKKNIKEYLILFCIFALLALGRLDEAAISTIILKIKEEFLKGKGPKQKKKSKTEKSILKLAKAYSVNVVNENRFYKIYKILITAISVSLIVFTIVKGLNIAYLYMSLLMLTMVYILEFNLPPINVIEELLKEQIIVMNEEKLPTLLKVKNYIFEKTKTLTIGDFRVTEVETEDEEKLFYYLNYGEYFSNHPIAEAIHNYKKIDVNPRIIKSYKEVENRGIIYQIEDKKVYIGNLYHMTDNKLEYEKNFNVGTIIYVTVNKNFIGSVVISDGIKYKTKKTIEKIKRQNPKHMAILSCDNERIVTAIAKELEIKDHYSNLTDQEKIFWTRHIMEQHKGITAIIGSNDTKEELYKQGDISICLTNDIDKEKKADIYLLDNDISKILTATKIVKASKRKNIIYSLGFITINLLALLLVSMNSLPLWVLLLLEELFKIEWREQND